MTTEPNPVQRSHERAQQSATTVARAALEAGASFVAGPAGTFVAKGAIALSEHVRALVRDRVSNRRDDRIQRLLAAIRDEDDVRGALSTADIESLVAEDPAGCLDDLLHYAIQDEEAQKARSYGRLYRAIMRGDVPTDLRIRYMRNLRVLSCEAIEHVQEAVWFVEANAEDNGAQMAFNRDAMLGRREVVQELINVGLFSPDPPFPHASPRAAAFVRCMFPNGRPPSA